MCGIAGIFDLRGEREIDARALKRMTDSIAHRGPDGEGFIREPGIGLGHRRLAIIDLAGGAQPFTSGDDAGTLIQNGEIYNFLELKRRLIDEGVAFRTNSDTELLVEGLNRHGDKFIDDLRGMYAFAFWNRRERKLMLARDRLGERPIYYALTAEGFLVFASEIVAIRASGLVDLRRRADAVHDYCLFGYVPDPKTIYEGVLKLPPGSTLSVERGRDPVLRRYWRPHFGQQAPVDKEVACERLRELLDDATTAQMIADVPLGAFLSGGVDSSAIVAAMSQSRDRVTTCTIGFDEAAFDERIYAREIAARYETDHHEEIVSFDAASMIDKIASVYGEPFADPSAIPTFQVCAAARRHVKVALSGDGGDEIFGGYRRYPFFVREERARSLLPAFVRRPIFGLAGGIYPKADWAPRPFRLKTTLQALAEDSVAAYMRSVSSSLPDRLVRMLSGDFKASLGGYDPAAPISAAAGSEHLHPLDLAQKIDIETWLPGRMLTKVDRAALSNGLEVRAPFLDHRLVDWALSLPPEFRLTGGVGKHILKKAQELRVGRDILYRFKQGFSPPTAAWLREKDGPSTRLRDSDLWRTSGYFNPSAVDSMAQKHAAGGADFSAELWMVVMFDAFLRHEKAAAISAAPEGSTAIRAA